jgi:hypothetical protein
MLATNLDVVMLDSASGRAARGGWPIAGRFTPVSALADRAGTDVAAELCGRPLLRYALEHQLTSLADGSRNPTWVTPTPYGIQDVAAHLALPAPHQPRAFVFLLDPSKIETIRGPHWILGGSGIEYFLPNGWEGTAILEPGFPTGVA